MRRLLVSLALSLATASAWAAQPTVGDQAPDYKLQDQKGEWHTLASDTKKGEWLVLYFYPKDFTAGKFSIEGGKGEFTNVKGIHEIYGEYASGGANAGVVKSAESAAMTKGEVSLAITGTGRGFNLGVDLSKFEIEPLGEHVKH